MEPTPHSALSAELDFEGTCYPVISFSGTEALSTPYSFTIRFHAPLLVSPDNILGKPACLLMHCNAAEIHKWPQTREILGILVTHRVLSPYTHDTTMIEVELRPRLSLLSLSGEPRVYVNKTAREIVRSLLIRHGYSHDQLAFHDSWRSEPVRYPHWVQAPDERDFDFFQRVLAREGISYLWCKPQDHEEQLFFVDDCYLHPDNVGTPLHKGEQDGLQGVVLNAMYELEITERAPTYNITYRDFDPTHPERVIEVHAGKGSRPVMIWGFGAQSREHLQRAATHHHEQLMMRSVEFKALTHNPYILVGHSFKKHVTWWRQDDAFTLLEVTHQYTGEHYHNRVCFIPKKTPIRPLPVKREAGQLMHTAVIHSDDDLPYLDKNGHYTYYTHVYHEEGKPVLQTSPRLSPYGGDAVGLAMGMHFPLRKQAEVVVMYLHNDFNQPILQNSPSNGLNHAPVTRDNSWSMLLKTAWGQYLEFCDREGRQAITLANAKGRNRLEMQSYQESQHINLTCERGPITLAAQTQQTLRSGDDITLRMGRDALITAVNNGDMQADVIHLQAPHQVTKTAHLTIESQGNLEAHAQSMSLTSEGDISISARGELLQIELPNGDIVWEADYLELSANDICLSTPGASIELSDAGITMKAQCIQFNTPQLIKGAVNQQSVPWPPAVIPQSPAVQKNAQVVYYANEKAKEIHPPAWDQTFYQAGDMAHIEVEIKGFEGHERGHLVVVRYHHEPINQVLPSHPPLSQLKTAETVHTHPFTLGEAHLYLKDKEYKETPGTARLRIPVPVHPLIKPKSDEHDPYYVRVELGDAKSHAYSDPMLILAKAALTLIQDKDFPFEDKDAIITVARALPDVVKAHTQCPLVDEARYYGAPTHLEKLPVGNRNRIKLRERGQQRELLRPDYTSPLPEQCIDVHIDHANDITVPRLMPPIIFDLNGASMHGDTVVFSDNTPEARSELNEEEIAYIKANGNNLTVFIHGFNVEYGEFDKHISVLNEPPKIRLTSEFPTTVPEGYLNKQYSKADATVYRDSDFIKQQFPNANKSLIDSDIEKQTLRLNGSGAHEWVIHFEHQLNQAAGFDGKNYQQFSRCLFIAWPGNPDHAYNYINSLYESVRMGPIVAKIIERLHEKVSGLKLHVIAHSQGNGTLVHALNLLGERRKELVDHAFFWQAAIPNNALSAHDLYDGPRPSLKQILQRQIKNPWYCPYAHQAAKKFTILYSQNDNILGHFMRQNEQPEGVKLEDVWQRKPLTELAVGLAITALNLKALYGLGVWIDIPPKDLLHEDTLARAWTKWRLKHPTFHLTNNPTLLYCEETLDEQFQLLKKHGFNVCSDTDFEENIRGGCEEVHNLLKERFKNLDQAEKTLKTIGEAGLYRTPQGRVIRGLMFLLRKILKHRIANGWVNKLMMKLIMEYITDSRHLVEQTLTFVQMTLLAGIKPRPAMGHRGIDESDLQIQAMINSKVLQNIKTTEWVWHHSDMKIGSEDIMVQVYKKFIINKDTGIANFGQYGL